MGSVNALNKRLSTAVESCADYQYSSNVQKGFSKVTEFNIILFIASSRVIENPVLIMDSMLSELSNTFRTHKTKKSPTSLLCSKTK